jgi:hypothetical protein
MRNEGDRNAEAIASSAVASSIAAVAAAKAAKAAARSARLAHERLTRIEMRQNWADRDRKKMNKKLDRILSNQIKTMGLARRVTVIEQAKRNYDIIKDMARGGWFTLKVLAGITLVVAALAALGFKATLEQILNWFAR